MDWFLYDNGRRHERVNENYNKPNCTERPLGSIKSVEPTAFPPCRSVLAQHIKRVWYIAKLYKSASEVYPVNESTPIDYGGKLLEGFNLLTVTWY